jgi:uncharacterized membrane protein YfcA
VSEAALAAVLLAAFFAGLVDAMVGGGGLIQLPALLGAFPATSPPTLLGTSKLAGLFGTASAAWRYSRSVTVPWRLVAPACALAFAASLAGAATVTHVRPDVFRPLVPVMLSVVLVYTLVRRDLGAVHAPRELTPGVRAAGLAVCGAIGFFGPGTGSFLMLLFIRWYGFDFVNAAASARVVNVATNASALAWFAGHGHLLWAVGLAMAVANVAGSQVGTRLALRRGAGFVRGVFVAVVSALIAKTGWDAFRIWQAG